MAVKKSFVSALPVHDAAAPPAADRAPDAEGVGRVVAVDRGDPVAIAVRVGMGATVEGDAVRARMLACGVVVGVADDPHAAAARSATRRRMAGRST